MKQEISLEYIVNQAHLQDSLLQSYRSHSLTLQSIFVAVGVGLTVSILSSAHWLQSLLLMLLLISVSVLSFYLLKKIQDIIIARGNDVNFWHKQLIKAEQTIPANDRLFTKFKIDQKLKRDESGYLSKFLLANSKIEDEKIDELIGKGLGHTRKVLDIWLFRGLRIIWIIILCLNVLYFITHFFLKWF